MECQTLSTNNLEYPIVPVIKNSDSTVFRDLNKNLTLEMGSPNNLKDLTYTGSFVGIDNLKGTWVGPLSQSNYRNYFTLLPYLLEHKGI